MNLSDKFVGEADSVVVSQCLYCQRLGRADITANASVAVCAAFPNHIPPEVWSNRFDHRKPHPDDGGLQFTPRLGVPADALARLAAFLDGV